MKKALILILTALLFVSAVSGCAGKDDPAPSADTGKEPAVTGDTSEVSPDTQPAAPDTDPAVKGKTVAEIISEDASEYGEGGSTGGVLLKEGDKFAFFADENAVYTYGEPWKYDVRVRFSDGYEIQLDSAFIYGMITVADLDECGFEYIRYEKGSPEYEEYYAVYNERRSALSVDAAVKSYTHSGWPLPLEFEPGGEVCDDDLYAYFSWCLIMGASWDGPAEEYAGYQREDDPTVCDIPVEVYETDLQKRFNVVFSDRISEFQSEVVPHAVAVRLPRGYGEGAAYVQMRALPEKDGDGIYAVDCYMGNYGYQGLVKYGGREHYCEIPAVTFKLGVRVNADFSYTYEFCRDLTEHYYTADDFSSLVPGVSTVDDVRAIAPETVVTDQRKWDPDARPEYIFAGFSKGPERGDGNIVVIMTPDGVVVSVTETD